MNCQEAREGLWPPERPRLLRGAVEAAQHHVRTCPQCATFFAQDRRLLEAYASLRRIRAPQALRARVMESLRGNRVQAARSAGLRRPLLAALGTGVLLGVAGGLSMSYGRIREAVEGPAAESAFMDDYLRRAVGQDRLDSSNALEVSRFLERELGMALSPLTVDGLLLLGAEICLLDGRRGGMIEYRIDGRRVRHYLLPGRNTRPRPPVVRAGMGPGAPPMVTWAEPSVEQALVGDIASERLLRMAREALRR